MLDLNFRHFMRLDISTDAATITDLVTIFAGSNQIPFSKGAGTTLLPTFDF